MRNRISILTALMLAAMIGEALARGARGGARPAAQPAARPAAAPSFGGARPSPSVRPAQPAAINRPSPMPSQRPNIAQQPSINRPAQQPSIGNRPTQLPTNRPSVDIGNVNRPSQLPTNRPNVDIGNRPNTGGNIGQNRPNVDIGNRPSQLPNNRPDLGITNRPNIDVGNINRPNQLPNNRPNIDIGNVGNRPNIDIGNIDNRPININNRPTNIVNNRPWGHYYDHCHGDWHHGWWHGWNCWPSIWAAGAYTAGWLAWGTPAYAYENPYYAEPPPEVVVVQAMDYSQPIPVQVQTAESAPPPPLEEDPVASKAVQYFDDAREAFKQGDYARAQAEVERAIKKLPGDATLHEFRALTLFAQKKYKDAAGTLYAVLAAGPGWDWETMKVLYPSKETYEKQLNELITYAKANPKSADALFVLAYHGLVLGKIEQSTKLYEKIVAISPEDKVSAELLKALKQSAGATDAPSLNLP
jgi:hypothetical protein